MFAGVVIQVKFKFVEINILLQHVICFKVFIILYKVLELGLVRRHELRFVHRDVSRLLYGLWVVNAFKSRLILLALKHALDGLLRPFRNSLA